MSQQKSDCQKSDGLLSSVKPTHTTLSPNRATVMSYDRDGRLRTFFKNGVTYKRGLDSSVHAWWRDGGRRQKALGRNEALQLFAEAYGLARRLLDQSTGPLRWRLEQEILNWTPDALLQEKARYLEVYPYPISILPPDCYLTVVLQATEGCSWNRCTFCNFYQDRPFRLLPPEEFDERVQGVKALFGAELLLRRGVFLGDGNALALSPNRLEPLLEVVRTHFPAEPLYGFVDLFTGKRHSGKAWRLLAAAGLRRVYIGMETGDDTLLRFLNKPGTQDEMVSFVREVKEAGISVGIIAMVGIGGEEYRDAHAGKTLEAVMRMDLGPADLVYLSPFVEHPNSVYARRRREADLTPMDELRVGEELRAMTERVRKAGARCARYDIQRFVY